MHRYVGITGFTTREQVLAAHQLFRPTTMLRKLMIGVVATYKSIRGLPMKEVWAKQTPPMETIKDLFVQSPQALNLVHYSTEKGQEESMVEDMRTIALNASPSCDGFQVNIPWPDIKALDQVQERYEKGCCIVLQIGKEASAMVESDPRKIADLIYGYREVVSGIILDMSGGMGQALDTQWARQVLLAIREKMGGMGIVVAGGLGPNSLELVAPLFEKFPDLSWDAQKLLRDNDNNLDIAAVGKYLSKSAELLDR